MAAKTIPPAASILVSSKLKTNDKTKNDGIANNKNWKRNVIISGIVVPDLSFNAVSYTHLTLPTNREV